MTVRPVSAELHLRRITAVYIVAQLLLAAALVRGSALVDALQRQFDTTAEVIDLAGDQRLLAERVVRLAAVVDASGPANRATARGALDRVVARWRTGQSALVAAATARSDSALQVDSAGGHEPAVVTSGQALDAALAAVGRDDTAGNTRGARLETLNSACDGYVRDVTAMVDGLQAHRESRARRLAWMLRLAVAGALLLVVGKSAFVFRPLIRRLRAAYGALQTANSELSAELELRLASERERDTLAKLLPMCSGCKRIRDSHGEWESVESYLEERSEVRFSHGLCEDCVRRLYPDVADRILAREGKKQRNSRGSIPT